MTLILVIVAITGSSRVKVVVVVLAVVVKWLYGCNSRSSRIPGLSTRKRMVITVYGDT